MIPILLPSGRVLNATESSRGPNVVAKLSNAFRGLLKHGSQGQTAVWESSRGGTLVPKAANWPGAGRALLGLAEAQQKDVISGCASKHISEPRRKIDVTGLGIARSLIF